MPTQENTSDIQNLKGPKAIMWTLAANIEQQNRIISKLHISFFLSFLFFCHAINMKELEVTMVERGSLKKFSVTQNMVLQCIY